MTRSRGPRIWLWSGALALIGLLLWSTALFWGDRTAEQARVGADLELGALRAPVLPAEATPFQTMAPLRERDLGRLVQLRGVAESRARGNALWVRSHGGRRILVRFEPPPPAEALQRFQPGTAVELRGYLTKISRAEFEVWLDTLNVRMPRPPPGRKFGDFPDPNFARVDSLFVKDFYISVRPEGLSSDTRAERTS